MNLLFIEERMSNRYIFDFLRKECEIRTDGRSLYVKDAGIYSRIPCGIKESQSIRSFFDPDSQGNLSERRLSEIVKLLKADPSILLDAGRINTGDILFLNGVYHAETGFFDKEFDDRFYIAKVNASYLPEASIEDAPCFQNFINTSLGSSDKGQLLLEILGYVISDFTKGKTAFFLIGKQSSGKSVILELLRRIVGEEDVSHIPFGKLGEKFNKGILSTSRINLCAELGETGFPDIDSFKSLTGADTISGEFKGKDGFSFTPYVKLINAGNVMPMPKKIDGTQAIISRLIFLIFEKSFGKEMWDLELLDKLTREKDVICSLAVKALFELEQRNFIFHEPESSSLYKIAYADAFNAVEIFVQEECRTGEENLSISSLRLWEAYETFCRENSLPKMVTQAVFVQKICDLPGVMKVRERRDGRQQTFFYGIGLMREQKYGKKRIVLSGTRFKKGEKDVKKNFGAIARPSV